MSAMIFCHKLKKDAEALEKPPFPGPLGLEIQQKISKQGWSMWVAHQTMLINEYRLNLLDPKAKGFLREEMQKFLFGEGAEKPAGYIPTAGEE